MNFLYLKTNFFYLLILNTALLLQGLILSNALRAQKNAEDEGCTIAMNNLRFEVIELRNVGLEKDKILNSLLSKIKEDETTSKAQAEAQKLEIEDLRKQLAEAKINALLPKLNEIPVITGKITGKNSCRTSRIKRKIF
jgi:hypothetical protein